jgi:flagellar protein FlaG
MDGSVELVSHLVNTPLVVRPATTQLEDGKHRAESPKAAAGAKDNMRKDDKADALKAVELANSVAEFFDKKISLSYDERINQVIIKVIRESTEEVIRQIPPEEMVELMVKLREDFRGLIFNHTG